MPSYSFQDLESGEVVDLAMSSKTVPSIDGVINRGGRRLKRLISRISVPKEFKEYASKNLCKSTVVTLGLGQDQRGTPVVRTRDEERRVEEHIGSRFEGE